MDMGMDMVTDMTMMNVKATVTDTDTVIMDTVIIMATTTVTATDIMDITAIMTTTGMTAATAITVINNARCARCIFDQQLYQL